MFHKIKFIVFAFKILVVSFMLFQSEVFAASIKLALNWKPEPQFGGFYAAQNYFKKEGLEVDILIGGSGTPTLQMLTNSQVELAIVSADEIILSHDRGSKDIVALFAAYQTNPQAIMTHAESNYKNLEDLFNDPNATLLWQKGLPYAEYLSRKWKASKVKMAPYTGGIGVFQNDKKVSQQCFATSEPLLAENSGLKTKVFLVADSGFNPYTTVVAAKASDVKKDPVRFKKIINAIEQGWKDYVKEPGPTNLEMQKLNPGMSAENFTKSAQAQLPLIQNSKNKNGKLGKMEARRWSELAEQMKAIGLIKNLPAAENLYLEL